MALFKVDSEKCLTVGSMFARKGAEAGHLLVCARAGDGGGGHRGALPGRLGRGGVGPTGGRGGVVGRQLDTVTGDVRCVNSGHDGSSVTGADRDDGRVGTILRDHGSSGPVIVIPQDDGVAVLRGHHGGVQVRPRHHGLR